MTLIFEVSPEEVLRVEAAKAKGFDINGMVHAMIAGLPEGLVTTEDRTLALLKQWREEDATDDEAELLRRDEELEQFKANMNANRALAGEEPVY